jgi:hypothetical protein
MNLCVFHNYFKLVLTNEAVNTSGNCQFVVVFEVT